MMSDLILDDLTKTFGGIRAVDSVSLTPRPHKINLLMGSNGSGKTTLINCISGFQRTSGGAIMFCREPITNKPPHQIFHKGIIRTFQTPRLFENLSVLENLLVAKSGTCEGFVDALFPKRWNQTERNIKEKALSILEELGLKELQDNLAYDLSGGQIKLLELGKVLMSDCKLVLLDEPIAGINPVLAHKIFKKITQICNATKTTFLIIEHRLDIALQYANFCMVLDGGKLLASDTPDKILHNKKVIESYLR